MITVAVYINGREIIQVNAVNVSRRGTSNSAVHTYRLDDDKLLKHVRNKGAAKLAIKMLKEVPNDFA